MKGRRDTDDYAARRSLNGRFPTPPKYAETRETRGEE